MEKINLPTENACEPSEEARQTRIETMFPPLERMSSRKLLTFADDVEDTEKVSSQKSSYKEALSQPPTGLSHRQKLLWLQKRRTAGLWAQCDDCDRWRYLPNVLDRNELPKNWYCRMNPDPTQASCSLAEAAVRVREEEDLVHAAFAAGSVVWARLAGWPWWPALVDDCPDTEQYYWLDGFSDIPTHYNVVFFDSMDVTRAWVTTDNLKPYIAFKKSFFKQSNKDKKYNKRINVAITQAEDAIKLSLTDRLGKYSFIARFKGTIHSPKKINKNDLKKHQKSLKRKFNIDFPIENLSDEDNDARKSPKKNVILLGTPKKGVTSKSKVIKEANIESAKPVQNATESENTVCNDSSNLKPPNSLSVQVGTVASAVDYSVDQDTSKTYVPETETNPTESTENVTNETDSILKDICLRPDSPNSDDFDF